MVKVTVRYLAQLKRVAGVGLESLEAPADCRLPGLLEQLCRRHPAAFRAMILDQCGQPQPSLLLFVGDEQVRGSEERPLHDGDCVTLLTPMAGG